jgi:hypothetical protein
MRILTTTAVAAVLGLAGMVSVPTAAGAQMGYGAAITVGFAPPPLPLYDQPPIPDYGYMWIPGYWAWDPYYGDYFWVPGAWVLPPEEGLLWTPAWWGWSDGIFVFHPGYWGEHVGYYGGIDYGFGYTGYGYQGGYWRGREFFYNRAVNNVRNVRITNVFERPVLGAPWRNRVSYNGGVGGVVARPTPEQVAAMRERHVSPTPAQTRHAQMAGADRSLSARVNHGAPPIAATPGPAAFASSHAPQPAYRAPAAPPPRPAYPAPGPGYRSPPPPAFPPARSGYPGWSGGAPRPQSPSYPTGGPPAYHPPMVGPGGAPPPRPAPPPAPRPPPPPQHPAPAQHPGQPQNPPH